MDIIDFFKKPTLKEYKEALQNIAKVDSTFTTSVEGFTHTSAIYEVIFEYSKIVRIYTNSMDDEVTDRDSFCNSLNTFLENKNKLQIIVDNNPFRYAKTSRTIDLITRFYSKNENLDIRISNSKFKNSIAGVTKNNETYYFVVGDDSKVAIENNYAKHVVPLFSFNNKEYANAYKNVFDSHFLKLQKVDIPRSQNKY